MSANMLNETEIRAVNLIEILLEEAEEQGKQIPRPPENACLTWTESDIRAYFQSNGTITPPVPPPSSRRIPPADDDTFKRWFPGLPLSKTACDTPKLRILCLHNAGNAEDMYTSEGTGARRAPSPLLEWCRENQVECLAPQYPGRNLRLTEPRITRCPDMATAILTVIASKLYDIPWVLVAHSVGTWVGYEFVKQCKRAGVPAPKAVFFSAMPSPRTPVADHPWRINRKLSEEQFKEECRGWDIAEVVFSNAMWPTYHPLLRDDFTLFDQYEFVDSNNEDMIECLYLYTFWGTRDKRVTERYVQAWADLLCPGGEFHCEAVQGNHLWPADKVAKAHWLNRIVQELDKLQALLHQ